VRAVESNPSVSGSDKLLKERREAKAGREVVAGYLTLAIEHTTASDVYFTLVDDSARILGSKTDDEALALALPLAASRETDLSVLRAANTAKRLVLDATD
jgi:hypothetical protein